VADSPLKASQLAMARYLRNPRQQPPPEGVESRRLKIYADLVYNNIEGFISGGFPVLRSLYDDPAWHALVRAFIEQHRCHTPYFLEISQEFVLFLMQDYSPLPSDPPFLAEMAHYEWVELALDVADVVLPEAIAFEDILVVVPRLSPLAWSLSYRFPVHRIGAGFRPVVAAEPTYLVVYRNRDDRVQFMELNATTSRLLEKLKDNNGETVGGLLVGLAGELNLPAESLLAFGAEQIQELVALSVVLISPQ
jgi:uncharacterized protein